MARTDIISHLPATPYTILRLGYLIICNGNHCAAKILSLFETWTKSKQDGIEQAKYHNQAALNEGVAPTYDETTWLYNSLENIRGRLLGEYSIKTLEKALKCLIELGFIKSRFNPEWKWYRTKQYQLQIKVVQTAINQITKEQIEEYAEPKAETLDFIHLVKLPNGEPQFTQSEEKNCQMEAGKLLDQTEKNTKTVLKSRSKESIQKDTHQTEDSVCVDEKNEKEREEKNEETAFVVESTEKQETPPSFTSQPDLKRSSAAEPNGDINIESITKLVVKALADLGVSLDSKLEKRDCKSSNRSSLPQDLEKSKIERELPLPPCPFQQWKEQIAAQEWETFINWKAAQAPPQVRDPLAWAYNLLKGNLERSQLSFESFQREKNQSSNPQSSSDGTPNFETWEMAQHIEVCREYIAKNLAFLKEKPWHRNWVEFIDRTIPELFMQVQGDLS